MIIELAASAVSRDIRDITSQLEGSFRTVRPISLVGRSFLAVSGDRRSISVAELSANPAIRAVTDVDTTAFFCRRAFSPDRTTEITIGQSHVGNGDLVVIAGPCSIENPDDLAATAQGLRQLGAHVLRAGAFKPRTSPYNFQGVGGEGFKILHDVGAEVGLPTISEVLDPRDVETAAKYIDVLQVGTRNMTNQALLKSLGTVSRPVLLKRGSSSKLEELIRAAEFITVEGNPAVMLCERGIQTFETATRFTFDLGAIPALRKITHLPVVADPSHAMGERDLVSPVALAAAVAGADAIMVEVHVAPERMIKPGDGGQALTLEDFADLMTKLRKVLDSLGRRLAPRPA